MADDVEYADLGDVTNCHRLAGHAALEAVGFGDRRLHGHAASYPLHELVGLPDDERRERSLVSDARFS